MSLIRRGSSCMFCAILISACHSTRQLTIPRPGEQLEGNPEVVSVTRRDSSVLTVYRPRMVGDSLIGWLDRPTGDTPSAWRVAFHIHDVRSLSARHVNATKTTGFALGTVVILVGLSLLISGTLLFIPLGD